MMTDLQKDIQELLKKHNLLSVAEYAKKKDLSKWYVRKLCRLKKVQSEKLPYVWVIQGP